jgi:hypothetical protein
MNQLRYGSLSAFSDAEGWYKEVENASEVWKKSPFAEWLFLICSGVGQEEMRAFIWLILFVVFIFGGRRNF